MHGFVRHGPCSGGALFYEIPASVGDDLFSIDSSRGIVTTRGPIDREARDLYKLPVYVTEIPSTDFGAAYAKSKGPMPLFDVATLVIRINDVNDHAPEFRPGTCYPLSVPENHETTIVHTIVATDLDEGLNADIIYTITGKFCHCIRGCLGTATAFALGSFELDHIHDK